MGPRRRGAGWLATRRAFGKRRRVSNGCVRLWRMGQRATARARSVRVATVRPARGNHRNRGTPRHRQRNGSGRYRSARDDRAPDAVRREMWAPGNVLWCETEDSASHTLAPRFEAARADKSRIRIAKIGDPLLADLRKTITENEVRMVVMSPFVSFLPGLEDANSELASRAVLQTLLYTVDGTKCAILGIMHPNKQVTAATLHRIMGSTAFVAFVRSVMVIGVKDDQKRLAHAKHNLTVRGKDLLYSITDTGANPDDGLICAEWSVAPDNCCVESLWNSKPEKRARTSDWLIAHLMLHGEQPANDVINAGIAAGYTAAAIMKACQRSRKVKSRREHYRGSWLWSVPDAE
jgi:hypothetical protein